MKYRWKKRGDMTGTARDMTINSKVQKIDTRCDRVARFKEDMDVYRLLRDFALKDRDRDKTIETGGEGFPVKVKR